MYFDRRIILTKTTSSQDSDGYLIEAPKSKEMWAHCQSATSKEFFAAMQAGVTVSAVYCIRAEMYDPGYEYLADGKRRFKIVRAYNRQDGIVELICGGIHDGKV
ncbi:MAG: phage head closure protein [Clostridia bacterium]|nr:phage head closure protein [Clostridia bacterium]